MAVIVKWTDPDGTAMAQVFPTWTALSNWLPPLGMHGVQIEEIPGATPLEFQESSQDDRWEDD